MDPNETVSAAHATLPPRGAVRGRERLARWALAAAALALLAVAAVHGAGYLTVGIAVRNSGLQPWLQKAFGALWLGYTVQALLLAAVLGLAAWRPRSVSREVVAICGLLPVLAGIVLFWNLDGLWSQAGIALLLVAATGVLLGAAATPGRAGAR